MSSSGDSADAEPQAIVPVICGPTGAGKSSVAMWLAQRHSVVVISADSRQIYRGFNIGTAKPATADLERVAHVGVDVVEPTQRYSAAQWHMLADEAIRAALASGRKPIIVGGTGFYIASLFRPLWAEPPLDSAQRADLQRELAALATEELRRWCDRLDPQRAHLGRAQLTRAVEIALLTGRRLSDMHISNARSGTWSPRYLLVDPGSELQSRIAARARQMFDDGWVEETRELIERVPDDAPAWQSSGYETIRQYVRGALDRDAALERIIVETRQYAKRQRTWFRHQLERDHVERFVPGALGWQESVERWMSE